MRKGYRILSGQVFDYKKFTKEDIVLMLEKRILFNDADIVAINKPYGMSIHSSEGSKSGPVLTEFLPKLSERLDCEQLYTVHRLDKETTGILLLTKTQEKAHELNRLFTEHKISKQYLCITRGVPDDREGVIDIPIEIGRINGIERMVLRPEALQEYRIKQSTNAKRAVTQYRVISESKNAALLEVSIFSSVFYSRLMNLFFID
jgi:23S rRNA-/tRNA-specific pseudouridylate synthase